MGKNRQSIAAAKYLCLASSQKLHANWKQTERYYTVENGNCVDSHRREFSILNQNMFSRCTRNDKIGFEQQCKHEIKIDGMLFIPELIDKRHQRRQWLEIRT